MMKLQFTHKSLTHFNLILTRKINTSKSNNPHVSSRNKFSPDDLVVAQSLHGRIESQFRDVCNENESDFVLEVLESDLDFLRNFLDGIFIIGPDGRTHLQKTIAKQLNRVYELINEKKYNENFLTNYNRYTNN